MLQDYVDAMGLKDEVNVTKYSVKKHGVHASESCKARPASSYDYCLSADTGHSQERGG